MKVITNRHVRESIPYDMLTARQRKIVDSHYGGLIDFDTNPNFVFYRGGVYFMGDCMRASKQSGLLPYWNGYFDDTAFSLIVVHSCEDGYVFGLAFSD